MGKSTVNSPAADPNIGLAQREMSALARDQWAMFKKDIYPELLRQSQVQEKRADEQWAMSKSISAFQLDQSQKAYQRYEEGAIPAMQKLKADADQFNTAAYQEQLAQGAKADISSAMANQRSQEAMRQRAYGIDPTSGTAQMASAGISSGQALLEAQAMNQTRQAAKDVGLQKQANVYNMYAGLPAQGNANTGIALGATGQGFAGGNAALGNFATTAGALNSSASTSGNLWGGVGNLGVGATNAANTAAANQASAANAASSGLGSAIGAGVALY